MIVLHSFFSSIFIISSSIKKEGLTFRQFSSLARCHGVLVQDFRADMSSVDHFRSLVRAMSVTSSTVAEGYASSSYGDPARLGLEVRDIYIDIY